MWQPCIISQAVKLNDRTHVVSVAWWASRARTPKMERKVICWMRQFHTIKLISSAWVCALSAKMRICSIFSHIQGHRWVQRVIIHINISHTHAHTRTLVQKYSYDRLSSTALFSCLIFMAAWRWLQADLIFCILRRLIIKEVFQESDSRWDNLTPTPTRLLTSEKETVKRKSIELVVSGLKEASLKRI